MRLRGSSRSRHRDGHGTDVAMEASDLTLMRSDLRAATDAIRLSRRTLAVIKGNLVWAFAYNVAALPLAMAWLLSPIVPSAAMAFLERLRRQQQSAVAQLHSYRLNRRYVCPNRLRVLFVSLGNHCRSPSALAVATHVARLRGTSTSRSTRASTGRTIGDLPHPLASHEGGLRGYHARSRRSTNPSRRLRLQRSDHRHGP